MKAKMVYLMVLFVVLTAAVGWAEDPDYADIPDDANVITTDGTMFQGYIETGDEDWFMFTPDVNTLYRVTLNGELNRGWKSMKVYQIDEFDNLHLTLDFGAWGEGVSVKTFFLEKGDDVYVKLFYEVGNYSFYFETLDQYAHDGYSDECETATTIAVDAVPTDGTLTHNHDGSLEVDWFVFDTEPLHKYEIRLTKPDNTELNFQLFNEDCVYLLPGSKNRTVMSWFGEQYKIYVYGHPVYLGTYYTLEVVDLGLQPDDYSNISETAEPIAADGSMVEGEIDFLASHHNDEDWFKFTPDANSLYRVTLNGELNRGWKSMKVYQIDDFDNLHLTLDFGAWSEGVSVKTFFLEKGDDVYVKLFYEAGNYSFYFEKLGQYPEDSYSDDCEAAKAIAVDAVPTEGTLTHNHDGSLEVDWFVFDTEPLHKYEIRLVKADNTDLNFQLFNEDCVYLLSGSKNRTVMSWFGEQYKIYVYGYAAYMGTYYTLEVVDLGLQPDDYPNIAANAVTMPKDGTLVKGEIEFLASYHNDEDWFTFVAGQDGDYQFMLAGELNMGWKSVNVYWEDELGVLRNKKNAGSWSDAVSNFTVALPAGTIYVQMYNALGGYTLSVVSPEPRCGDLDHPYPPGDNNGDCRVDLFDLGVLAANWLTSTEPNVPDVNVPAIE